MTADSDNVITFSRKNVASINLASQQPSTSFNKAGLAGMAFKEFGNFPKILEAVRGILVDIRNSGAVKDINLELCEGTQDLVGLKMIDVKIDDKPIVTIGYNHSESETCNFLMYNNKGHTLDALGYFSDAETEFLGLNLDPYIEDKEKRTTFKEGLSVEEISDIATQLIYVSLPLQARLRYAAFLQGNIVPNAITLEERKLG